MSYVLYMLLTLLLMFYCLLNEINLTIYGEIIMRLKICRQTHINYNKECIFTFKKMLTSLFRIKKF